MKFTPNIVLASMLSFGSEEQARDWISEKFEDDCCDNVRFAFVHDTDAMLAYTSKQANGCCGFYDRVIQVQGMDALIGCNYGH